MELKDYDYVVVGGGSAGCVLAARLSEQRDRTVLLLEAGGSESLVTDFPIAALNLQNTPLDWGYRTEVQEMACFGLKGRTVSVAARESVGRLFHSQLHDVHQR